MLVYVQWLNFIFVLVGIFYTHLVVRRFSSFYIGVPILVWLSQAIMFYFLFFLDYYNFVALIPEVSEKLFYNWTTMSFTLGLVTMFIYLYYIQNSCWRGNVKL